MQINLILGHDKSLSTEEYSLGHIGEHNIATLVFSGEIFEAEYYRLAFRRLCETLESEKLQLTDGQIVYPLPQSLLKSRSLEVQLVGYTSENDEIVKIEKSDVLRLEISPSLGTGSQKLDSSARAELETAIFAAEKTTAELINRAENGDFDGFSPVVSVQEDNENTYTLKIATETDVILTPNLRGGIGPRGDDGTNGVSPEVSVYEESESAYRLKITAANGTVITPNLKGSDGERGPAGPTGPSGSDGQDGLSPTIEVQDISDGHRVTVTDINGSQNFDVLDGTDSNILKAQTVLTSAVNVLTINTDTNGDPFALKHAQINIYVPETATPSGSTAITLRCSVNGVESENSYSSNGTANSTLGLGQFRNGGNHAQINLSSVGSDGKYILIGIAPVMSFYDDSTPNITAERYTVTTLEAGSTWEYIRSVKLFPSQSSSVLPVGTAVEIWGY